VGESTRVLVRAPSNIAIVKYMGKSDFSLNLPANSSLSLTLSQLCTYVEVRAEAASASSSRIVAEKPVGSKGDVPSLSDAGSEKFLRHFERCRARASSLLVSCGLQMSKKRATSQVSIRTTNTFPSEAGIASSASSYAALTLSALYYFSDDHSSFRAQYENEVGLRRALAELSREGSGSSCRSFEGPFVTWSGPSAEAVNGSIAPLSDLVVIVSAGKKAVGSSEAHRRVETSTHWAGRVSRAESRFRDLKSAIHVGAFKRLSEIAEADFRDMHHLFETSAPPFSYFAPGTDDVLEFLESASDAESEPPFAVTMDAGPNVHVLVPQTQEEFWRKKITQAFPQFPVLVDRQGTGAEILE
jgi:diphosphomevalonate decarboxylase